MSRTRALFLLSAIALCAPPVSAQSIAKDTEFRVRLLSPVDTDTSRKGDRITAQVTAPPEFAGDIMEGQVRESKSGHKIKGSSVLNLSFDSIEHGGSVRNVRASVVSLANSQGKQNVDEEGRIITKKNNIGKAAAVAGVGALIGGIAGGARGAAIGGAAGAAAALIFIEVGVEGPRVSFAAGSEFVLSVVERK